MYNILIAPDSFKESLDAFQVAEAIKNGLQKADSSFNISSLPLSDGGDGSLDVIAHHLNADLIETECLDPLMRQVKAPFILSQDTAFIEMAKVSGLHMVEKHKRNALSADSYGTGQLVKKAIEMGAKQIVLCLGGTATMDGGHGILRALGFRFLSAAGKELAPGNIEFLQLEHIELPSDFSKLNKIKFQIYSDVTNPLVGDLGAARTFAEQKGADRNEIEEIEMNLSFFARKIYEMTGIEVSNIEGGGAAGGVPAGLAGYFSTEILSGAEKIMDIAGFDQVAKKADFIIVAEGKCDNQTIHGKLPEVVARRAKQFSPGIIFIAGQIPEQISDEMYTIFDAFFSISPGPVKLADALMKTSLWLESTSYNIGKLLSLSG